MALEKPSPGNPRSGAEPVQDGGARRAAVAYLYGLINYEKLADNQDRYKFRLNRMRDLLRRLSLSDQLHDPLVDEKPTIPTIHLAGTKGKGSTATMIAAMLSASGFRTGLYTSPHVHDLEERFRVDGDACPPETLVDLVNTIRPICDAMTDASVGTPTFFEVTTAMALLHFQRSKCDAQVLEVGLGGRLDSTNVVRPSLSIITTIGLDHQHVLGNTLAEIAGEKAGILKNGVPVISGVRKVAATDSSAAHVITTVAAKAGCPLETLGADFDFVFEPHPVWGSQVSVRDADGTQTPYVHVSVEGQHQASNASLAIRAIQHLASRGITNRDGKSIDETVARSAFNTLNIIGRLERFDLPDDQTAIVDTSHNEDSIDALIRSLQTRFRDGNENPRTLVIVFASSRDKDARVMLRSLQSIADHMVLTRFHRNLRFLPVEDLQQICVDDSFPRFDAVEHPHDAVDIARQKAGPGGVIVVCGSFFLADETRLKFIP